MIKYKTNHDITEEREGCKQSRIGLRRGESQGKTIMNCQRRNKLHREEVLSRKNCIQRTN